MERANSSLKKYMKNTTTGHFWINHPYKDIRLSKLNGQKMKMVINGIHIIKEPWVHLSLKMNRKITIETPRGFQKLQNHHSNLENRKLHSLVTFYYNIIIEFLDFCLLFCKHLPKKVKQ